MRRSSRVVALLSCWLLVAALLCACSGAGTTNPAPAAEEVASEADFRATFAAAHCGADWNEQALGSALSYLDYTAFSYDGLVRQLEFEKFTHEQAVYGADNCGADWNEQAARCAQSYIDYTSFSRDGLISQPEFEGFTHEQAACAADAVGC